MKKEPFISVIIPAYHDWGRLSLCLDALQHQSLPQDRFEVIIINNDPQNHPSKGFTWPQNATLLEEGQPGSYAARNKGIRKAKGSILAFTDSDCIPAEDWLLNALVFFKENPKIKRMAGHISLTFQNKNERSLAEQYEEACSFRQEAYARGGTAATANMICYKKIFDQVGLFDDRLMSSGDFEWSDRAESAGFAIKYAPDVVVNHPARARLADIWKKSARLYKGIYDRNHFERKNAFFKLLYGGYLLRPPLALIRRLHDDYPFSSLTKILLVEYIDRLARVYTHYRLVFKKEEK